MSEHVFENTMTYSENRNNPKLSLPEIYNPIMTSTNTPIIHPTTILPKIINSPSCSHKTIITQRIATNK